MLNPDPNPNQPFTRQELARIIAVYFDESELQDLCFQLDLEYDHIRGQKKDDKARELVTYMWRHGRYDELVGIVWHLRPHIGLNLETIADELFQRSDPRSQGVRTLLEQLRHYHQKLYEWKRLHNHLDETINVFSQYGATVERQANIGAPLDDIGPLDQSWQPVHRCVNKLLLWAQQDMQHIGKPFKILETGQKTGEKWAIDLHELHCSIRDHLQENPLVLYEAPPSRSWNISLIVKRDAPKTHHWRQWWRSLRDLTRNFDNMLTQNMFLADSALRKTADDLFQLSEEAFGR